MIIIKKENIFDLFNAQHPAQDPAVLPESEIVQTSESEVVQSSEPDTVPVEDLQQFQIPDPAPLDEAQTPSESEVNEDV